MTSSTYWPLVGTARCSTPVTETFIRSPRWWRIGTRTPVPAVTLWFDANRDGVLDLFTLHQGTNILYLGTGFGTYVAQYPEDTQLNLDPGATLAAVADMDGDTRDDLVVAGRTVWSFGVKRPLDSKCLQMAFLLKAKRQRSA